MKLKNVTENYIPVITPQVNDTNIRHWIVKGEKLPYQIQEIYRLYG